MIVGCHHHLNGHEFEQAPGVGDGKGGLACCSPWGCKELDMTDWLNGTELIQTEQRKISSTSFEMSFFSSFHHPCCNVVTKISKNTYKYPIFVECF